MEHLLSRAGVAEYLNVPVAKLYRDLGRLQRHPVNPFPRPVYGNGRGARWDPKAITRWVAAGGEACTARQPLGQFSDHSDHTETSDPAEFDWAQRLDVRAMELLGS